MRKIIFLILIFFTTVLNVQSEEIKRITVGNKDAKITIIAFESLTCSHCANFHKNVFPELKKEFLEQDSPELNLDIFLWILQHLTHQKLLNVKMTAIQIF